MLSPGARAADAVAGGSPKETVVTLNPFEVQADSDKSYGALNSNSVTDFNTSLEKLPISADIFTQAFMQDTASTNVEQMLYTYSAGAGNGATNASGGTAAYSSQPGDRLAGVQLRAMSATVIKTDGFAGQVSSGTGSTSNFNIERVEVINGPESLLYGTGGAGGVINLIQKKARLGAPAFGSLEFQIDQYGHKLGQLDFGAGSDNVAVRVAINHQTIGGRRLWIGGPFDGYYAQVAAQLFHNTVVRVNATNSTWSRVVNTNVTLTAASTANDARNGQFLTYLLATNQIDHAANNGASGAGVVLNGTLNWDNVNSYGGSDNQEKTVVKAEELSAETQWSSWLSTKFEVQYRDTHDFSTTEIPTIYAPNNTSNPLGTWAASDATPGIDITEPSRSASIRISALATNDLFNGHVHSRTIVGLDGDRGLSTAITYEYFQADSNFNPIITPSLTTTQGRTPLPRDYWPIGSGPIFYNFPSNDSKHINFQGTNYVQMIQNPINPALISAANPLGVSVIGGADYERTYSTTRGFYAVNDSEWLDDRLDTLIGVRVASAYKKLDYMNPPSTISAASGPSYNAGINYRLLDWLRPYATISSSYAFPTSAANDPYGATPVNSKALGEEIGIKVANASGTVSGSIAAYHIKAANEGYILTTTLLNDINPSGLNGRFGSPSVIINVAQEAYGVQPTVTASPTPNWRIRFSGSYVKGTIGTNTSYGQLYNDQFHENSAGQVTYADGTVVYVNPTYNSKSPVATSATPGAIPLTVALMNTPTSPYYANPLAVTGQILATSNVGTILRTSDPAHGAILTGATGLPISQIQITPSFALPGTITTSSAGDSLTGYPSIAANFTSVYTLSSGWMKGFKLGGTLLSSWRLGSYYYYTAPPATGANVPRVLQTFPTMFRADGIFGYQHRFGRVTWSTQLNITNIFNHYHIVLLPNPVNGWAGPNNATFDQQPRAYVWTNTVSF